jgi:Zn finger protein HypA/HybF involved in hydrogenase expression
VHDYHAVSALVARLSADPSLADNLDEVHVRASPVFSQESLEQAYEMQTIDTPLAGSRLVVEELADRRGCAACGANWVLSRDDVLGHTIICPACGALSPIDESVGIELVEITNRRPAPTPGPQGVPVHGMEAEEVG